MLRSSSTRGRGSCRGGVTAAAASRPSADHVDLPPVRLRRRERRQVRGSGPAWRCGGMPQPLPPPSQGVACRTGPLVVPRLRMLRGSSQEALDDRIETGAEGSPHLLDQAEVFRPRRSSVAWRHAVPEVGSQAGRAAGRKGAAAGCSCGSGTPAATHRPPALPRLGWPVGRCRSSLGRRFCTTDRRGNGSSVSFTHTSCSGKRERRLYGGLCAASRRDSRTAASSAVEHSIAVTGLRQSDHLGHPGPLLRGREVGADPIPDVSGRPDIQRAALAVLELIDAWAVRAVRLPGNACVAATATPVPTVEPTPQPC